jgi:hypothetical protein
LSWKWNELGARGGVVITKLPIVLSIQWPRAGGTVAQWWIAGRFVGTAAIGVA